ncbi:elongation factor EF-1 gamma subunit, partial [Fusarium falciforme]
MSQGTLYANFRIRTWVPRGLVKALKLDVKVVTPDAAAEQFARDFPLKKVPAF